METGFKVNIITVVYNAGALLEKTIQSVVTQTYKNINHIIIDGGSTDTTLSIIQKYKNNIGFWSSEKDNGIYDAMNKGLKQAKDGYVWFLNAGDEIYSIHTLENLSGIHNKTNADAYYGEMEYVDEAGESLGARTLKRPPESLSWESMIKGMVVSHQAILIKAELAADYNTAYRHTADVDWMIRSLKKCKNVVNTRLILCRFLTGGYSKRNIWKSNAERYRILRAHFSLGKVLKSHVSMAANFIKYYFSNKKKLY
jgi:glycosyltransferase involved in cell wall biosynthesis